MSSALKLFSVLLLAASLFVLCHSQLTFTPAWGKRSGGGIGAGGTLNLQNTLGIGSGTATDNTCKTPLDSLMLIYRLIQNEAQKLLECSEK